MNKIFVFALPALLALSLVARPVVAQTKPLTAAEVLEAAAQKYANFKQFQGTTSILVDGESSVEGEPPSHLVASANSRVDFVRAQSLEVTGDSGFVGTFEAFSTPASTTIEVVGKDGKKTPLFVKAALDREGTAEFMGGLTGVSGGGGATLPALLLSKDGDLNPLRPTGVLALLPERNLGLTPCYVVTRTDAEIRSASTFWIEKDSFLLRRLEIETGEQKSPEFTAEILAQYPQLKDMPAIRTHYVNHTLIFATQLAK